MNIASVMAAQKNITDNRSHFTHRKYRRVLGAMCKRHGRSNAGVEQSAVAWSKEQCRSGGAGGVVEQCKRSSGQCTTLKRRAVQTLQMD